VNQKIPAISSGIISEDNPDKYLAQFSHFVIPLKKIDSEISTALSKKYQSILEKFLNFSFASEILKSSNGASGKVGDSFEFALIDKNENIFKFFCVFSDAKSDTEIRKIGIAIGRKVKATKAKVLSFVELEDSTLVPHLISFGLATYNWNLKSSPITDTPELVILGNFKEEIFKAKVILENTWEARNLIHTPANIKSPKWIAAKAKGLEKIPHVHVKVRSGKELAELGGLSAVGNSSKKNPPRFVEISYSPKSREKLLHVVLVGKGITFDTGGVSLKRPYDAMMAMKSDMAGAAAVMMATAAAAQLGLKIKVTALLMLAENALSGSAQRPSDVIYHYGGITSEVINTDAEGRLVLADGLAYAVKNLKPDFLVDVATLTGAATLGLSRYFGAMYTRDSKLAAQLHSLGDYVGDRVWHMPLVDDYAVALESDVADFNHTADKFKFQAGSVTAALFLEKFVEQARWVHLDIAGPARSESDSGENPKGGTGFGVRLLTEWLSRL
jgi:leucyl aminopeptidase